MTVSGQFGVSPTGAATYSIPVPVPPGTAGLAPALSLNYSSQSGNGILGFGWSLGGLPAISRCPRTNAQDGIHGSVNYDGNDRFCLDGQRLLVVNGGTYGQPETEYRTEIESFSKIVAHGTQGNDDGGLAHFDWPHAPAFALSREQGLERRCPVPVPILEDRQQASTRKQA